jgi:Brp/Blh family beta-carotene 15,15'-monooxygenase
MSENPETRVLVRVRSFSSAAILTVVAVSLVMSAWGESGTSPWQVWLAVAALAIGIPHGALDHLVTVPSMRLWPMVRFVAGYISVAALAVAAIMTWPVAGFIGVVVMSAVHFGMGDASFVRQAELARGRMAVPWWVYAIPAGALPVVIPLTNAEAANALALVNPVLVGWHFGLDGILLWSTALLGVASVLWLTVAGRLRDAGDVLALGLLALLTPPLVAFAAYFGLWHALRHTARLSLEYEPSRTLVNQGAWLRGLWRVTVPGLPALVGTMIVAAVISLVVDGGWETYLWVVLAVIWALTVPHMALTWRLDREVLLNPSGLAPKEPTSVR